MSGMTKTTQHTETAERNLGQVVDREVDTRAIDAASGMAQANALLAIVEELHIANLQRERDAASTLLQGLTTESDLFAPLMDRIEQMNRKIEKGMGL